MFKSQPTIYLASKSPRRRKLLKQLFLKTKYLEVEIDETLKNGDNPIRTVKRLSEEKNRVASSTIKDGIVITADTIVVFDGKLIGKPRSKNEAFRFLKLLSGQTHFVYTGVTVSNTRKNLTITDYEKTAVTFRELYEKEIKDYIQTGSPMDKAGAYGIQDDFGAVFVKKISGCYYNVVGLPLSKLYLMLLKIS